MYKCMSVMVQEVRVLLVSSMLRFAPNLNQDRAISLGLQKALSLQRFIAYKALKSKTIYRDEGPCYQVLNSQGSKLV